MRKWMMMLLVLGLLIVPVCGAESEAEAVLEGVPQEAQAFMPEEDSGFLQGVLEVARKALLAVTPVFPRQRLPAPGCWRLPFCAPYSGREMRGNGRRRRIFWGLWPLPPCCYSPRTP